MMSCGVVGSSAELIVIAAVVCGTMIAHSPDGDARLAHGLAHQRRNIDQRIARRSLESHRRSACEIDLFSGVFKHGHHFSAGRRIRSRADFLRAGRAHRVRQQRALAHLQPVDQPGDKRRVERIPRADRIHHMIHLKAGTWNRSSRVTIIQPCAPALTTANCGPCEQQIGIRPLVMLGDQ